MSKAEDMMLKSFGVSTQLCFTSFVTGKASDASLSSCTQAVMPSWIWRSMVINLSGHPNLAIIFQRPSLLTVSKAFVRLTKVLWRSLFCFLALLLEVFICKDHVHCVSTSAVSTLMSLFEVCMRRLRRTLARILPAMDNSDIPR